MVGAGEKRGDGALGSFIAPKQREMGKEVCVRGGGVRCDAGRKAR
jgi:hypothetical protein